MKNRLASVEYLWQYVLPMILFGGTIFTSSDLFVDKEVLPQWIVFSICALAASLFSLVASSNKESTFKIDVLSLFLLIFSAYLLLRICFSPLVDSRVVYGTCFLLLMYFFKANKTHTINNIIVFVCTIQAIYGLLQYTNVINNPFQFPITGTFDNPAGFAVCMAVGFSFCLPLKGKLNSLLKITAGFLMALSLILSGSRAGLLSVIVVAVFHYYTVHHSLKRYGRYLLLISLVFLLAITCSLFFLKKDSASGRLLIWQVSTDLIKEHPVFGSRPFGAEYMVHQADFFEKNPEDKFSMLADNVSHPFNEYLLLGAEFGLIGFVLSLCVIFIVFKYNYKNISPFLTAFSSILVFSCFSYPLRYAFIWLILAHCLTELARHTPIIWTIKRPVTYIASAIIVVVCISSLHFLAKDVLFEYKWKKVASASLSGSTKQMIPEYESLLSIWNHNPLFLYNYGAELNHIKNFVKSTEILSLCEKYFNDYDVQMLLADNHFNLKQWERAEKYYKKALLMCPNRFMPLGRLLSLYKQQGDADKAKAVAKTIMTKTIKVNSGVVTRIKNDATKYLSETQDL